ncbi:MAG: alpha-L-fucosidase [Phenylobacterium sp.]|uniref:alpha-L-fucosidase n=1 Tax=Phenylobacterium sp. TaxID=1871053 RepID=UPI0025E21B32|nr:alpha-L-fucosidase [Phenylobacterium sp.]MBA4011037.1 alpha-L-fucosidase [Phenylobacterium sp.]
MGTFAGRALPGWYDDAKFGVFIHWGLFSIPAFAPKVGKISDIFKTDYRRAVALSPYTEWYENAIKSPDTPSAAFHRDTYGGAPYRDFREPFLAGLSQWDPDAWAEAIAGSGARYVVLVTKHHDGYCLWPSRVAHPHAQGWRTERDVVGELAAAVRRAGLRFGVYYSGGIDWSFNPEPLRTLMDFVGSVPGGRYPAYATAQTRELVERYEPSVLWNDISWPTAQGELDALFDDYYAAVPDGVVNDRWKTPTFTARLLRHKLPRLVLDRMIESRAAKSGGGADGVVPPPVPHSDFRTPEYVRFADIQDRKWEATRGMSHSFGFNRNDGESDYESVEHLLLELVDSVSKGGNLLLNIGPRGDDAQIPTPQIERLNAIGAWLRDNGEAVYATRPWRIAEAQTQDGAPVRFTTRGGRLNIIPLTAVEGRELLVRGVTLSGLGARLSDGCPVELRPEGEDTRMIFARPRAGAYAPAVAIDGGAFENPGVGSPTP